ncbi:FecCD family ABC transporter permease [Pseudobutyrivibrio xylanivorans]|uniref:Iron ABC transporter permease n=1 Tax=Pseudobutyrivibrio xylanivorans TaxID=185007 RepID=A0A5P6VUE2_PSEXY|nr:iron ABC transporter permease [Pseudobutyrivibrio xylanivorans]QFJ56266.1 iron ABC transporter permease [Pseudobutyrivibrio xylanivorans]
MAVLLIVVFFISLGLGSAHISVREIWQSLLAPNDIYLGKIIFSIRLPRILSAIILGGALAVSGFLLQIFFGNPIAGPYVLGISSGAKLFVAIAMVLLLGQGRLISAFGMVICAFAGSLLSMGLVMLLANKVRNMSLLVVCGVMIGYICSAITEFIIAFADDSNIVNLHNWSLGSFSGTNWDNVAISLIIVLVTIVFSFLMSKPIGAYQLGEAYARNMGVNIRQLRIILILLSSILSATVTAFAGPISFVGIAVPHIMRMIMKTAKPIIMIPACFFGGAIITLVCDCIARTAFAPTELSISAVTAVLLAPVVIVLLVKKKAS